MSANFGLSSESEIQYNTMVYNLMYLMQYRLRKFYAGEEVNEKNFESTLLTTFEKCKALEKGKLIKPMFSEAITDLIKVVR